MNMIKQRTDSTKEKIMIPSKEDTSQKNAPTAGNTTEEEQTEMTQGYSRTK